MRQKTKHLNNNITISKLKAQIYIGPNMEQSESTDKITISDSQYQDSGIFDFMSVDRAVELYNRITSAGIPELDWKFYGRRKPSEQKVNNNQTTDSDAANQSKEGAEGNAEQDETKNTEFDFEEELSSLHADSLALNESLQLKKRPEPGSEKKTSLSDIMSDIMKESQAE